MVSSLLDVKYVAPFPGFLVFVKDIQGCDYVMFNYMKEDIVLSLIGIVDFHMVSVLLGQSVVSFDPGRSYFN